MLLRHSRAAAQRFMFELLVPATRAQMDRAQGGQADLRSAIRPELMLQTIRTLQEASVERDVATLAALHRKTP